MFMPCVSPCFLSLLDWILHSGADAAHEATNQFHIFNLDSNTYEPLPQSFVPLPASCEHAMALMGSHVHICFGQETLADGVNPRRDVILLDVGRPGPSSSLVQAAQRSEPSMSDKTEVMPPAAVAVEDSTDAWSNSWLSWRLMPSFLMGRPCARSGSSVLAVSFNPMTEDCERRKPVDIASAASPSGVDLHIAVPHQKDGMSAWGCTSGALLVVGGLAQGSALMGTMCSLFDALFPHYVCVPCVWLCCVCR
jgi:hypothetical protein